MANVDLQEVAKFEALASRWWDRNSEFKPLHDINPLRANWIDSAAKVAGKQLLDVGCGGGILTEAMAQRGAIATGLDMGEAPIEVAKLHALESGLAINYLRQPVEELAAHQPESFDVITCMEMLEHVPSPFSVIQACFDLVKPNSYVFFSTINRNPKAYAFAILGAEYLLKMLPKGTHDYKKFIRPSELTQWCREAGFQVEAIAGLTYNPLSKHYKVSDSDVSVNYMIRCKKLA